MAQLLSPVCTDALKCQNPLQSFCSRSRWRMLANNSVNWSMLGYGGRRKGFGRVRFAANNSAQTEAIADDYYAVLGLLPDATPAQIKKAYYNCMKACHPDLSGNEPETTNFCMFINEVYAVLSDPVQRMIYDEIHGYALTAINPFLDDSSPKDHAFVDEFSCIGCKNCANVASDVFGIEEDFGRARVYSQSGNPELVQRAIDSCPVDCIHWTSAAQLSLLEDEMRRVERVNVAIMLSGMGSASVDVFRMASTRWQKRQAKVLEQAKLRMMKQKNSDKNEAYWSNLWGKPKDYKSTGGDHKILADLLSSMMIMPRKMKRMVQGQHLAQLSKNLQKIGRNCFQKILALGFGNHEFTNDVFSCTKEKEDVTERAKRAAAAARRWREYSRRGVDKPPTFKLPEAISNKEN